MGNASAFISVVCIEQNMDLVAKKENFVDYIASRPGAERRVDTWSVYGCRIVPVMLSRGAGRSRQDMKGLYGPSSLSIRRGGCRDD
ncbi:MAG: hypothetical protein ACLTW9_30285 [Enterocloster sp.]